MTHVAHVTYYFGQLRRWPPQWLSETQGICLSDCQGQQAACMLKESSQKHSQRRPVQQIHRNRSIGPTLTPYCPADSHPAANPVVAAQHNQLHHGCSPGLRGGGTSQRDTFLGTQLVCTTRHADKLPTSHSRLPARSHRWCKKKHKLVCKADRQCWLSRS